MADEKKMDFSLPGDESVRGSAVSGGAPVLNIVIAALLVLVLAFQVYEQFAGSDVSGPGGAAAGFPARRTDAATEKAIALALEDRGLFRASADAWKNYLSSAGDITAEEEASLLYRVGRNFQDAGEYESALEYYFRSEDAASLDELAGEIGSRKKDCFRSLGNVTGLNREIRASTDIDGGTVSGDEPPLAEIGSFKITGADLQRKVEEIVDMQLGAAGYGIPQAQLTARKEEIMKGMLEGERKSELLSQLVQEELFYREALEAGLEKKAGVVRTLEMTRRSLLASTFLKETLDSVREPSEVELRAFFEGNRAMFAEAAAPGSGRAGDPGAPPAAAAAEPTFEEAAPAVEAAWRAGEEERLLRELSQRLMAKHKVKFYR